METVRLNKYLAECGVCSRRDGDKLIEQGRVLVNGQKALVGAKVTKLDQILVNGKPLKGREKLVVLAYNKPVGVICTEKDKHASRTISQAVSYPVRVTYAGRLDKDSEGLMILTNDGDLIDAMMRGGNRHEKEYVVKVDKEITPEFLTAMAAGVYLKELEMKTRPCLLQQQGKYTFQIILTQGLNRQIRRMCRELGYEAKSIRRIRIMNIRLERLETGKYRELTAAEINELYHSVGLPYHNNNK